MQNLLGIAIHTQKSNRVEGDQKLLHVVQMTIFYKDDILLLFNNIRAMTEGGAAMAYRTASNQKLTLVTYLVSDNLEVA